VKGDARPPSLDRERVARDLLPEGREFAPLVVAQDEARVARLGLERLHLGDGHYRFSHVLGLFRARTTLSAGLEGRSSWVLQRAFRYLNT